jgi:hypothetical protein
MWWYKKGVKTSISHTRRHMTARLQRERPGPQRE